MGDKEVRYSSSDAYLAWVKQAELPPLTNTQAKFAEWLLEEEQYKILQQIGDLDTIFLSVRKYIKKPLKK